MTKTIQLFILGLIILFGCKKEKEITNVNEIPNTIDLFRYNTGNFWIYRVIETHEDSTKEPKIWPNDTILVEGDSTFRGKVYKKIRATRLSSRTLDFYRDSLGFLINNSGKIIFSTRVQGIAYNHFVSISNTDTLYKYFDIIDGGLKDHVTQTFGSFKTYLMTRFYTLSFTPEKIMRTAKSYYAPGFGLVHYEDFYIGTKRGLITSELIKTGKR